MIGWSGAILRTTLANPTWRRKDRTRAHVVLLKKSCKDSTRRQGHLPFQGMFCMGRRALDTERWFC